MLRYKEANYYKQNKIKCTFCQSSVMACAYGHKAEARGSKPAWVKDRYSLKQSKTNQLNPSPRSTQFVYTEQRWDLIVKSHLLFCFQAFLVFRSEWEKIEMFSHEVNTLSCSKLLSVTLSCFFSHQQISQVLKLTLKNTKPQICPI